MRTAKVYDSTGKRLIWPEEVTIQEESEGRFSFWSPYENPELPPGNSDGYFNNQQGVLIGSRLILRYDDENSDEVLVSDPPRSELGNKGRSYFVVTVQ